MLAEKEAQKFDGKDQQAQLSAAHPLIGSVCPSCQFRTSHTDDSRTQLPVTPIRLIPVERVGEILGFKNSTVLALAARGELPQKIKFGTKRRASARWVEHEIYAYAWGLAANREPVQTAETPHEVPLATDSSPSKQHQVVAAAKKPTPGRSTPKSGGKAK
jgi:predicted DNA-binding transcriptional regulator AlpA